MQPLNIIMIDDNPGDLQLLQEAFADCRMAVSFHGFCQYDQARVHLDGLHASQARLPDLIIIDFSLPGMTGDMIVADLRRMEALRTVSLIIISGMIPEAVAEHLLSCGVSRVLKKPKSYDQYLALAASLGAPGVTASRD